MLGKDSNLSMNSLFRLSGGVWPVRFFFDEWLLTLHSNFFVIV